MNRVVNQITNRVLPRDPARPAAREPNERGRKRATLLPGLISPKVLAQEYQDVTENGTNSVTQDKPCCRIRCAPSISEPNHSMRTNSSGRHGGTHRPGAPNPVLAGIMRARIIMMLCVASVYFPHPNLKAQGADISTNLFPETVPTLKLLTVKWGPGTLAK